MRSDRGTAFRTRGTQGNGERSGKQAESLLRADALALRHRLYRRPATHRGEAGAECDPGAGTDREDEGLSARRGVQMEHGSFLASRTVLQDRDSGTETEVRASRTRTPHWPGRAVWESATRPGARRGTATTDGIRDGARPPLRREGGFDDDQRRARTDLGHCAITCAGGGEVHF